MFKLIKKAIPPSVKDKIKSGIKFIRQLDYRDLIIWMNWIIGIKLPSKVRIDASSLCQLNCRGCFMRRFNYGNRGKGYLKFTDFEKFVKMNPYIKEVELSNLGEVFLNPDLKKIIQFAYSKKVKLTAWNGVNFNTVSDEILETLVKYQFYGMNVAIDGSSQEIYSWYRRNGNFDKVIDNIKKLKEYKDKYHSYHPIIVWQYVVSELNQSESEIKRAKEMAHELGCKIIFIKDWDGFIPDDLPMVERETGLIYENKETGGFYGNEDNKVSYSPLRTLFCVELWTSPQINYDGRLMGCCPNMTKDYGVNVFEIGLKKSLYSDVYKRTKKMLMGGEVCEESPCIDCSFYKKIASEKNFITKKEIKGRKGIYD